MRSLKRIRPARALRTVAALMVCGAVAAACTPANTPAKVPTTRAFGAAIEGSVPYQPAASKCVASGSYDKPGTIALRNLLLVTYGTKVGGMTVFTGITRPCDGTVSEHHDGRALDWGMDYRNGAMRADGQAVMNWLFATDKYGNRDAIARRLGVMYIIWNKQLYGSWTNYQPRPYACGTDPTACHVNHMHFSLDWAAARMQTSFFTGKVA